MTRLANLSWTQVDENTASPTMLVIPIGSTEQHGPHLPLSTDTDLAIALCDRLAAAHTNVLVAPALAYGSAGEHAGFPGTLSIGQAALELVVIELVRSATDTFDRVLLVSAHGGNAGPISRAARQLRSESRDVHVFWPLWDGDPHAGFHETSMMLSLHPDRVRMNNAERGNTRPLAEILTTLRISGVGAISANGVLGDPTHASAEAGAALLDTLFAALLDAVAAWPTLVAP
ncbi:mycofactocin biosynthesis peptidyl-dipeptidase MftE [Nocardia sp. NPDC059239]|uniref:mycofactocin biosynthesis peptidyl-dipeptidase MftE n=1 Tax=unclassified Nocardia TaxID=2637762 RepID=UPI0036989D1D